jgi:hypothetical protein
MYKDLMGNAQIKIEVIDYQINAREGLGKINVKVYIYTLKCPVKDCHFSITAESVAKSTRQVYYTDSNDSYD